MRKTILGIVCFVTLAAILVSYYGPMNRDDHPKGWTEVPSSVFHAVYAISDESALDTQLFLIFPSGEADSPYTEGLAHYVEHLAWLSAFQDSENDSNVHHSNAWTNQYTTGYMLRAARGSIPSALRDLMTVADPIDLDETFAIEERDIVMREYDYRVAEQPLDPLMRDIETVIYAGGPLARSVIGSPDGIETFTVEQARQLHGESHDLSQATLLIYGNFRPHLIDRIIANISADVENPQPPAQDRSRLPPLPPMRDERAVAVAGYEDELFLYQKLIETPACGAPVRCEMLIYLTSQVLDSALPGGIAGPLRYDNFVARSFDLFVYPVEKNHVMISFEAWPDRNVSLLDLQSAFEAELQTALQSDLPVDTYDRIMAREMDRMNAVTDPANYDAEVLLTALQTNTAIYDWSEELRVIQAITRQDLSDFMTALSQPGRVVIRRVSAQGTPQ